MKAYEVLKNISANDFFEIELDGQEFIIPVRLILAFLESSQEDFEAICKNDAVKNIGNIPKKYFAYACVKYFVNYNIYQEYEVPESVYQKLSALAACRFLDIEAINQNENDGYKTDNVVLNEELVQAIMGDIPDSYTLIEKVIYIYIKMCKILTYDAEFFVFNEEG
ncbi:MAG: hypothetical protein K2J20_01675, partial [Bacilli bacterium]|nr:hypothetical protein [Bacilli bacterium]